MEDYNKKSWFSKNWSWALPVGCCSGCLVLIVIFIFGIGTTAYTFLNEIEESLPIDEVLVVINKNPKAIEILGENIISEGFPNGNISIHDDNGEVKFSIQVSGEKSEATLYVNGIRANKKWIYEDLYIIIRETGEQINLLENTVSVQEI